MAHLVEDQTGVQTTVSYSNSPNTDRKLSHFRRNVHETHNGDKQYCCDRFRVASRLAEYICQYIERKTQFHTTTGICVSPLLAKIAGGMNKPKAINVLYPWRSSDLLYAMPLRKMNNVGYRSFKALQLAIEETKSSNHTSEDVPITVKDLLEVPRENIIEHLSKLQQGSGRYVVLMIGSSVEVTHLFISHCIAASEQHCDLLLERCRGLDTSEIVDDEGGLSKTVSVEDSFRRGTVKMVEGVWAALDMLCLRLPSLIRDRAAWSSNPKLAYPTNIRLTVRLVDTKISHRRRPFATTSKQCKINGRLLLEANEDSKQSMLLKEWAAPLLKDLIVSTGIDLTRMNLAVTNFVDLDTHQSPLTMAGTSGDSNKRKTQSSMVSQSASPSSKRQGVAKKMTTTRIDHFFAKK